MLYRMKLSVIGTVMIYREANSAAEAAETVQDGLYIEPSSLQDLALVSVKSCEEVEQGTTMTAKAAAA